MSRLLSFPSFAFPPLLVESKPSPDHPPFPSPRWPSLYAPLPSRSIYETGTEFTLFTTTRSVRGFFRDLPLCRQTSLCTNLPFLCVLTCIQADSSPVELPHTGITMTTLVDRYTELNKFSLQRKRSKLRPRSPISPRRTRTDHHRPLPRQCLVHLREDVCH